MTKKTPKAKYRSEIAGAMHETLRGMHRLGLVDQEDHARFRRALPDRGRGADRPDIVAMREEAGVSQAVFARVLNVHGGLREQTERGAKRPSAGAEASVADAAQGLRGDLVMSSIYRSIRPASSLLAGDDAAAARGLTRSAFSPAPRGRRSRRRGRIFRLFGHWRFAGRLPRWDLHLHAAHQFDYASDSGVEIL